MRIAGIDIGTNVGIAVFDLFGNLMSLESFRNVGEEEIIERLQKYGRIIVLCVDVKEVPETVKRVASKINAKVFSPPRDLSIEEKKEMTKRFKYSNVHERDALAAALYYFKVQEPLFKKIEKEVYEKVYKKVCDEVKRMIIFEDAPNIEKAIEKIFEPKERVREVVIFRKSGKEEILEKRVAELRRKVKEYREKIKELLKKEPKVIKEKVYVYADEKLKEKAEKLEERLKALDKKVKELEKELEMYRKYRKAEIELGNIKEIVEIWRYIPFGAKIFVKELKDVNRRILKILKDLNVKEIVFEECDESSKILEKSGIVLKKKELKVEDIIKILKG